MSTFAPISQPFVDIELPARAIIGLQEQRFDVGETVRKVTVRGTTRILAMPWTSKVGFTLTASGRKLVMPPSDVLKTGDRVVYREAAWHTSILTVGTRVVADRPVSHAEARTLAGFVLDTDINDDTITVSPRVDYAVVRYRLLRSCIVTDGVRPTSDQMTGLESAWTCTIEEEAAYS